MSKNIDMVDDLHEKIHNREQWIAELEKQLKLSRAGERVALKCCKELEEQLKNAIVPKFKIGQEVFIIFETTKKEYVVESTTINSITIFVGNELSYYCKYVDGEIMYLELDEKDIFATKEDALAKLKELGENK